MMQQGFIEIHKNSSLEQEESSVKHKKMKVSIAGLQRINVLSVAYPIDSSPRLRSSPSPLASYMAPS